MSNTVDNRVVEMKFDNQQFEEGVKQTVASLNSLEKALQINTDATNLRTFQNEVNRLRFDSIEENLQRLSDTFTGVGRIGTRIFDELINKALRLSSTLANASIGQIITGGKGRAMKVADARFKLEGLLETAEDVEKAFQSAKDAVDGTAYGMDAAVSVAARLTSSQVALGDDLDQALRGIAGLAAMTNTSFEYMGDIFATVAGNGRLMGDQLRQISGNGVNAAAVLAKSLNKTEAEVREMTSKGEINFEMFSKAMSDAFGDQAAKADKTFVGVITNIKAQLSRIGEVFYGGIIENDELIAFLGEVKALIKSIVVLVQPLGEPFKKVITSIAHLGSAILKTFDVKGAEGFVNKMAEALEKISTFIDGITEKINKFTETMHLDKVTDKVQNAVEKLRTITEAEKAIAQDIWAGRGDWGNGKEREDKLGDKYRDVQDYVNSLKEANWDLAKADEIYSHKVIENSNEITDAKERERQARERSFNTVNKIGSTEKKHTDIYTNSVNTLVNVFTSLKNIIVSIGSAAKETFSLTDILNTIKSFVKGISDLSTRFKVTDERAAKIKDTFKGLFSLIDIFVRTTYNAGKVLASIFIPAIEKVGDGILTATGFLGRYISKFNDFLKKHNVFSKASKSIINTLNKLKEYLNAFIESIKNHTVFSDFIKTVTDIASAIREKIIPSTKEASDTIGEVGGTLKKVDTRWITNAVDKIAKVFEKLTNKLKASKDRIVNTISGIINTFNGLFKPKKKIEELSEASTKAGEETEKAVEEVVTPYTMIFDLASKIFDKAKELFKSFVDYMIDVIKKLTPQEIGILMISTAISTFFLSLTKVSSHATKFIDKFAQIGQTINDTIKSVKTNIDEFRKDKKRAYNLSVLQTVAAIIAIIAIALYKLSEIDTAKLIITAGVLAALTTLMIYLTKEISNFGRGIEDWTEQMLMAAYIKDAAKFIIILATSIFILSAAFKNIAKIDTEGIWIKLAAFTVVFAEMVGAMMLLSKYAPVLSQGIGSLVAISFSIMTIAMSLALLSKMDTTSVLKSAAAMAIAIVAVGGSLALAGITAEKIKMGPLIAMIVMLGVVATSLFALTIVQKIGGNIIAAAIAMAVVLSTLVIAFAFMKDLTNENDPKDYKAVTIIGTLALALVTLSQAVKNLSEINDYQKLAVSVSALLVIMYVVLNLMVTVAEAPPVPLTTVAALGAMILAMITIATSLRLLLTANTDWKTMLAAAGAMGLVLVAVAGSLAILTGIASNAAGAGGMLIAMVAVFVVLFSISTTMISFSVSLAIFTKALGDLMALDFTNFGTALKSLMLFGGVMAILGVALIPAGVGLAVFSVGLLAVSIALTAIGSVLTKTLKGFTQFINAIMLLGNNGQKIAAGLNTVSTSIKKVIVEILRGIAAGLIEGARVIAINGAMIALSVASVCATIVTIIGTILKTIITLVVDAIILLLSKIDEKLPHILTSIQGIIIKVLTFLANNVEIFAYYGTYIINGLIIGILNGMEKQLPGISDAIGRFTITAINAFVDTLYKNQDAIRDALRGFIDIMALTVMNVLDELFGGLLSSNNIFGKYYKGIMDELGAEIEETQKRHAERRAQAEDEAYINKKEKNKAGVNSILGNIVSDVSDQSDVAAIGAEKTTTSWSNTLQDSMMDISEGGLPADVADNLFTLDTDNVDLTSMQDVGSMIPEEAAEGIDSNQEVLHKSFDGMYYKQVEEMKNAGWHEEVTDEGKVLVRDLSSGVEEETKNGGLDTGINTVTNKFSDVVDKLGTIGNDGGSNWLEGLIRGMKDSSKLSDLENATKEATDVVANSTQSGLHEESPSKLSALFGTYWIEGLANGIDQNHDMLERSADRISDVLISSMAAAVSSASDIVTENMTMTPVIKPIIDSSNLQTAQSFLDTFDNTTSFKMAADSQISVNNSNQMQLANQVAALQASVDKLANTDFSHMMDGVNINVNADTTVDGTVLRKTASNYTIRQINKEEMGYMMATGGRY